MSFWRLAQNAARQISDILRVSRANSLFIAAGIFQAAAAAVRLRGGNFGRYQGDMVRGSNPRVPNTRTR
ncbi:MAG: hypothetical protein JO266_11920 [Acidobacteria bacterium]|nr:hypothetical protein [Acidobacteriota bacterium]